MRRRVERLLAGLGCGRELSLSKEPLTDDQRLSLIAQGSNKDTKAPITIAGGNAHDELFEHVIVEILSHKGGGATSMPMTILAASRLTDSQRQERVELTKAGKKDVMEYKFVPRYMRYVDYLHDVYWGKRAMGLFAPTKTGRGGTSVLEQNVVVVPDLLCAKDERDMDHYFSIGVFM